MLDHIFRHDTVKTTTAATYRDFILQEDVREVLQFARDAHEGQTRKYTGDPYIVHPIMVAQILCVAKPTADMVKAALLHDVVEDTPVEIGDIQYLFGPDVAHYVAGLTDTEWDHPRPNRATRKAHDAQRLAGAGYEVQTIKFADFLANGYDIVEHDPHFAKQYLKEMGAAIKGMKDGHAGLRAYAQAMIDTKLEGLRNE